MSKLRSNRQKHTCQGFLGKGHGICGELAVIRCNACKAYFCEECWQDHLELSVVVTLPVPTQTKEE